MSPRRESVVRAIEVLLLVLTCAGIARVLTPWRTNAVLAIGVGTATLAAFTAHVSVERPRWQLLPVYVVALAAVGFAAADGLRPCGTTRRRAPLVCAMLFALLGGAAGWALPVAQLSEPSGPYPVGTTTTTIVDDARSDPYRGDGAPRRLALQLWYPAATQDEPEHAPWVEQSRELASVAADWLDVPAFTLQHLGLVTSHATRDAPIASGDDRPLVLYAHGWSGFRNVHSTQLESLASHGYVVAAVDHAPGSLAALHPEGEVVPIEPAALPNGVPDEEYQQASKLLLTTFADDLDSVVAHVVDDARLDGRVDTGRIAMIGHSAGGGAAILACGREPDCHAAVGFDPWVEPLADEVVGQGLEQPLLSIRSEEWAALRNDARLRRLHAASHEGGAPIAIAGSTHRDFTLLPMLTPLATRLGLSGSTGGHQIHRIVDDLTLAFLDHHVRGEPDDPLEGPPDHPEVTIERALGDR